MSTEQIERAIRLIEGHHNLDEEERQTLRNIFSSHTFLGLGLEPSSATDVLSDKQSRFSGGCRDMASNKSRDSSGSPGAENLKLTTTHTKGGVKLPSNGMHSKGGSHVTENGMVIVDGSGTPSSPNGGPSSAKVTDEAKLNGKATSFKPKPAPISFLNRNSTSDDEGGRGTVSPDTVTSPIYDKGKGPQHPIGTRGENVSPGRGQISFSTDVGPSASPPGGHYMKLKNIPTTQLPDILKALYEGYGWHSKLNGTVCPTPDRSGSMYAEVYFCFDDIRDAERALEEAETVDPNLTITYISQSEYAAIKKDSQNGTGEPTSFHDGQILFVCEYQGRSAEFSAEGLEDFVISLAKQFGRVVGFVEWYNEGGKHQFRTEYTKISDAKGVVKQITHSKPAITGNWIITTKELPDWSVQVFSEASVHHLESSTDAADTPHKANGQGSPKQYTSPTGRTAWVYDAHGNRVPVSAPTQLPKCDGSSPSSTMTSQGRTQSAPTPYNSQACVPYDQGPRSASWSGPMYVTGPSQYYHPTPMYSQPRSPRSPFFIPDGPNKIYLHKIQNGTDVRTSIMLRNLPNNMTFRKLKEMLDFHNFGKYDFSYLRIDFNNNKNVGYAFVNFTDPLYIIPFYQRHYNNPWLPAPKFGRRFRPRIADIAYGTIQGLDCLIEKMRNSSVMDENKDFRPKLWWTVESAPTPEMVGTEKDFPGVNNPSKKQRSRDNATQIGLYTSGSRAKRHNQANGAHQSQYDRGTTAQLQEEAYFNQMSPANQMSPMQNGFGHPGYMLTGGGAPIMGPSDPFPQANYGGMNQYDQYGNAMAVMDPMSYNRIQFSDPFSNGYGPAPQVQPYNQSGGRASNTYVVPHRRGNGYRGSVDSGNQVQSPTGGAYALYPGHCGYDVPRAIIEEVELGARATASSNGQYGNGNTAPYSGGARY